MWKPRHFPYAKVLIAAPNSWERRQARECLNMMKVQAIFETDQANELAEAFWTNDFQLVVAGTDLDPKTSKEMIEILHAADALGPYVDRVLIVASRANLKTLRVAQSLGISSIVLKPYSIYTFCTHAEVILMRTATAPAKLKPLAPLKPSAPPAPAENSQVDVDALFP
jgi:DNA-binding NarL/FixJ family response regulator